MAFASTLPRVNMRVNSPKVETSDDLVLTVEVNSDGSQDQAIGDPSAIGMVLSLVETENGKSANGLIKIKRYKVRAKAGSYVISPPIISLNGVEHKAGDVLYIDIGTNGPSSDLAPLIEPPKPQQSLWGWLIVMVGSAVFGWWGSKYYATKRRKKAQDGYEILQKALQVQDMQEGCPIELSKCFRVYLQNRFFANFLSLSPNETKNTVLQCSFFTVVERDLLLTILNRLDQIKYSNVKGRSDVWDELKRDVRRFVSSVELQ